MDQHQSVEEAALRGEAVAECGGRGPDDPGPPPYLQTACGRCATMAADDPLSCPQKPDVQLWALVGEGALHGPSVEGAEDGWR